jgi:hypothetical protein
VLTEALLKLVEQIGLLLGQRRAGAGSLLVTLIRILPEVE